MNLRKHLNQPYNESVSLKGKLISIFSFGFFVFFILYIMKPIGHAAEVINERRFMTALEFGFLTSLIMW